MKIIVAQRIKIKFMMSVSLVLILSLIAGATVFMENLKAIRTSNVNGLHKTVIIDAGHGGVDGGTQSADGTLEKDLNLLIATKVNEYLKSFGVSTLMTRMTDISIHDDSAQTIRAKKISDLKNRLNIISSTPDSVFVSIHQNHFSQTKYSGTQIFYSPNNPDSINLAECIRLAVTKELQPNNTRELKKSGTEIYLLYHSKTPSVMVECGFLSNTEESAKLKTNEYQNKIAYFIASGILNYLKSTEAA